LDEIEKASSELLPIFLTLLDEGYLVDGFGEKVDAKNLIVIATSNAGREAFAPEFINRFDKVLTFASLSKDVAYQIGQRVAEKLIAKYQKEKQVVVSVTKLEIRQLIDQNFNPENGAREIERVIHEFITEKLSRQLLKT
jgi:ATP-dependent Clp protease ATP-binding subunit ClpA